MKKLLFGTAGIPISTSGDTVQGIHDVKKLGLDNMELEFVRSINITKERAPLVSEAAKKNNVVLTCHAPYYVNLNSHEKQKYHASINRILSSARIAHLCGGYSVCFHAGYYMGDPGSNVLKKITKAIKNIVSVLQDESISLWIRPEISGKPSAFGSEEELIKISEDVEQVLPCIDFAHLHARTNGKNNTYEEFSSILAQIERRLGRSALNNMHIHVSGIEYGEKGERKHLTLKESDMNYKDLMKAFYAFKLKGVVISESPNIEKDALLMKRTYEKI
ncbi:TIM barrel protein [Candidatus Aenigmatarchaeota archaeon]